MKIPSNFENIIANTFYDKEIEVYETAVITASDGWKRNSAVSTGLALECNVTFDRLDQIRRDYGLDREIHVLVTTKREYYPNLIGFDNIFDFEGVKYRVVSAINRDSHLVIMGERWVESE